MIVALDAMGGDNAPFAAVKGAVDAVNIKSELKVILVGKENLIKEELKKYKFNENQIEINHTDEEILMKEDMAPALAVRKKKDASMNVALRLVKEGTAYGCVSAGNTGALMTASQLTLKRIKGVLRPAMTAVLPTENSNMVLLDVGANADCKPEYLEQFALMGAVYAKLVLKTENPRIGLANIGEEPGKGNELSKQTFDLLNENKKINFIGNIETTHMMIEDCVDVVVADGFTGNMILKTAEGAAKFVSNKLKQGIYQRGIVTKLGALLLKPVFNWLKDEINPSEAGGALFMGLNGVSLKTHGSSDCVAFKWAILSAANFAENDFVNQLKDVIQKEA